MYGCAILEELDVCAIQEELDYLYNLLGLQVPPHASRYNDPNKTQNNPFFYCLSCGASPVHFIFTKSSETDWQSLMLTLM